MSVTYVDKSFINGGIHRTYSNSNGILEREEWRIDGKKHRRDGGPTFIEYFGDGQKWYEEWHQHDKLHSQHDRPAQIFYDDKGFVTDKSWWKNDVAHRGNDKPAEIEYWKNSKNVRAKQWIKNHILFRDNDKPHRIEYFPNGIIKSKRWDRDKGISQEDYYNDGTIQKRRFGPFPPRNQLEMEPSEINYRNDGTIECEEWYSTDEVHHRLDGPAFISYRNNGDILQKIWYLDGDAIKAPFDNYPLTNEQIIELKLTHG